MNKKFKADISLLLVTIAWGASFILTKNVLAEIGEFNFLAIRFFLAFVLAWIVFFKDMIKTDLKTLKNSAILGILMFVAFSFQTLGISYTSASKAAFITGMNVVMVPLITSLFLKERPENKTIMSVIIAFLGLGMLTLDKGLNDINLGDIYTFISAIFFAVTIIALGKYTKESKSIPLAVNQFGVVAIASFFVSIIREDFTLTMTKGAYGDIIILVVFCTIVAYVVQSVAQKYTSATHTALIFTGEPVFAGVFGYILLGETLGGLKLLGALVIVFGMLLSEIPLKEIFFKNRMKIEREFG